ncbi:FAD-dependent oxidoreductase [Microbacterium sp. 71-36]|uniref:FAD-dependent oxidoreductase n=1 Tax=Microbacterium sp. 71-36 TaxID=1895788 RepID=UPI000B10E940|nr:FAD-dependent oxidoreductase [Microbacterium sp. 71-36]
MTVPRTVIVGGVAGGTSAATRLRRLDDDHEIVVVERGPYVSFANCGLPYYVGGEIADRSALLVQTPDSLRSRFALDVRVRHEVVRIDAAAHAAHVRDLDTDVVETLVYDHLILSPGSVPVDPPPADDDAVPVLTLRTVDDVDRIVSRLDAGATRAVVAGGGFIGLEAVENLTRRGIRVSLVHRGAHPFRPLDAEMAGPLIEELRQHDVDLHLSDEISRVTSTGVALASGARIDAEVVIDARGTRPDTALAAAAGLTLGPTGGIAVDPWQRTSDPRILAVGDAVEKIDAVSGEAGLVTMAGLANRHGRTAADVIALGADAVDPADAATGVAILRVFDLVIASVGAGEARLRAENRPHRVLHTHPTDHAGYFPGAERMAMKLLVDPADDGILGAQIVGGHGVDRRIDVLSLAMQTGVRASRLARLELAYAPPFGSAKDAVNQIGYVADNVRGGLTRTIQWHELDAAIAGGATVIDVRTPTEVAAGAIPGALSIPLDTLRAGDVALPDGPLVVHCQVGQRGHTAARLLTAAGHDVRNLDGGYLTWLAGRTATATATEGIRS